jgi:hypothetical protein
MSRAIPRYFNVLGGLIMIGEGLVKVVSLGFVNPSLEQRFLMVRVKKAYELDTGKKLKANPFADAVIEVNRKPALVDAIAKAKKPRFPD